MTKLIICEKYRIAKAVAKALKATEVIHYGIYSCEEITVAFVRKDFITLTPLSEMADGKVPFVPARYRMNVTDKVTDRRLRRLFRDAGEVVFASGEGAEAQARFFNLCRHFRVGQPTSRMWLTSLDGNAVKVIYSNREKGRVLHDLAQTGLAANGMEMLFDYNFGRILDRWYYDGKSLTRQEAAAISFLGEIFKENERLMQGAPEYRVSVNCNGLSLTSEKSWKSEAECAHILNAIKPGATAVAEMSVEETTDPALSAPTMPTLQMDAYDNLGFLPSKTIAVANRLYERGIITSPYTHNPEMGIMPLRPLPRFSSQAECAMYDMIAGRIEGTTIQPETHQTATYTVEIAGVRFSRTWRIPEPKPEYVGTTEQETVIGEPEVIACMTETPLPLDFSTVMYNLGNILKQIDSYGDIHMPYSCHDHEWGTAFEGLMLKGFINMDSDGITLTPEGRRLVTDTEPYNLLYALRSPGLNPNAILLGHAKGREVISAFESWITETIGDMLRYVPEETSPGNQTSVIPAETEK